MRVGQTDAEAVQTMGLSHAPHFAWLRHSAPGIGNQNARPMSAKNADTRTGHPSVWLRFIARCQIPLLAA